MLKDINGRADIALLVNTFYSKIRADEEINFYFNEMITDWEAHLEKLTNLRRRISLEVKYIPVIL